MDDCVGRRWEEWKVCGLGMGFYGIVMGGVLIDFEKFRGSLDFVMVFMIFVVFNGLFVVSV